MEFRDIVMKRYAVKKFDGKKVDQKKVDALFELIRYAPSSFNIQPWKIKVVTDQKTKEALLPLSWNQPQITTCSHLLVFCADTKIKELIDLLEKTMIAGGAKKEQIAGYMQMMYDFEKGMSDEKKLTWAQRQTYIALGNAMNGAASLGFDSCPMEGFDPAGYAKILKLPAHIVPTAVLPIGFAADTPRPKVRFSQKDILI